MGKHRPNQQMWGLLGPITIGLSLDLGSEQLLSVILHLLSISTTQNIVRVLKNTHTLQLWFSGPQAFCDFLIEWRSAENSLRNLAVRTLPPPAPYVAILPDDMMAVQELPMTREGMDTESSYLQCKSKGVEPVVTSALHQLCGNP